MKKIYLDTMIYNKLLDENIDVENFQKKVNSNNYVIIFSLDNFLELYHTAEKDPKGANDLLKLSYSICSKNHIVKDIPVLIKDDMKCFFSCKKEDNPFISGKEKEEIINYWYETINSDELNNDKASQEFFEDLKNKKKNSCNFYKDGKKKFAPLYEPHKDKSFQEFYEGCLQSEEVKDIIKNICITHLGEKDGSFICQNLNLNILRHLRFKLKSRLCLIYSQLTKNRVPNRGDDADINHVIYSSIADIFVTNDENLQKLFIILNENRPKCINFEKFKKLFNLKKLFSIPP